MKSIRARLLVALMALIVCVSIVTAVVTYRRVLNETSILFDYQLRQMALTLRSQISVAPHVEVPPDQGDADFVIQIWDAFGARVYLSRPGLPMLNRAILGFADLDLHGEAWRAYGLQTAEGVIQIAQPLRVRALLARDAALHVVAPLLLLLPVMTLCVLWIVNRGLFPLRDVTAEVQRRDAGSLTPVSSARLPRELAPLVEELNRLLGRLDEAFGAQRAFVADAAHELRSPLTSLRLQLQLLDRAPDAAASGEARRRLGESSDRAIHLVEQLLTLARLEPSEGGPALRSLDLCESARSAIAACHSLALARIIEMSFECAAPVTIYAEAEAIHVMIRNLVDNAVRYTPPSGTVRVACSSHPTHALLEVVDSGPGIPPPDRRRVFDRFYRLNAIQETGTGLGLAIVKATADRYGAKVTLDDAPGGGLLVRVVFPQPS